MKIVPIGMKAANEFVARYHRHHNPVRGCKFCVSVEDENTLPHTGIHKLLMKCFCRILKTTVAVE